MGDIYSELADEFMQAVFLKEPPMAMRNDLSKGEMGILLYLTYEKDSALSGELASRLNLTTGRIASAIKTLEGKGYIIRIKDRVDGRKVTVIATDKGVQLAKEKNEEMKECIAKLFKHLGEDDAREYLRIVKKIQTFNIQS